MEVTGHKAHGAVPEPGSIVIARVSGAFKFYHLSISSRFSAIDLTRHWLIDNVK